MFWLSLQEYLLRVSFSSTCRISKPSQSRVALTAFLIGYFQAMLSSTVFRAVVNIIITRHQKPSSCFYNTIFWINSKILTNSNRLTMSFKLQKIYVQSILAGVRVQDPSNKVALLSLIFSLSSRLKNLNERVFITTFNVIYIDLVFSNETTADKKPLTQVHINPYCCLTSQQ